MVQHITKSRKARDEAKAHYLRLQYKYNSKCINCWTNDKKNSVFYLIKTFNKESVKKMYNQTFSLVVHKITLVNIDLVDALLNSIKVSKSNRTLSPLEAKIYNDPDYRAILVTKTTNTRLLQHILGIHKAYQLLLVKEKTICEHVNAYDGYEIESKEDGFIASFTSSCQALDCASSIQKTLDKTGKFINFRIGIHAGILNTESNIPHKNIAKLAYYLCGLGKKNQIVISSTIHELYTDYEGFKIMDVHDNIRWLFPCEEDFLEMLMDTLAQNFQNPRYKIIDYCKDMMMSKSQLYRKCKSIIGISINELLSKFRLSKSLEILNKTDNNIAQTSYLTGFSSTSYFSKSFKKRFGFSPTEFLKDSVAT